MLHVGFVAVAFLALVVSIQGCDQTPVAIDTSGSEASELQSQAATSSDGCAWTKTELVIRVGALPSGLDRAIVEEQVKIALNTWFSELRLTFRFAADSETADVLFEWVREGDIRFVDQLAYTQLPPGCLPNDNAMPRESLYMESSSYKWRVAADAERGPLINRYFDIQSVVLHEVGHMLGLSHCEGVTGKDINCETADSIMHNAAYYGSDLSGVRRTLFPVDIRRIEHKYPDP